MASSTRKILDKEIKKYDYLFKNNPIYNANKVHPRYDAAEVFLKRCGKVKTVGDMGSGRGIFFDRLTAKGYTTFAMEPSMVMVNERQSPYFIRGTCDDTPYANEQFDVVFCLDVFEHIPSSLIPKSLTELKRITKKYLILSAASHADVVEKMKLHISVKTYPAWDKLISKEFKIIDSTMIHSKTYPGRTAKMYLCEKRSAPKKKR